ncbi:MAG: hypothetical protein C6P37_04675 [Caldibacillus debilis]|uniref:Uncharacterized protein n=1 Tax=Caldibacillus debilis TaxID=301148 RepID=A0A3E0K6J2_9BACI|nr:hypothetical protein [Caldibacillus debilis]REJ29748.1 MAG: hypothetical protein C6P37_04675 [Caldibacillus debilis]
MNKWLWYFLVVVAAVLLILSFLKGNALLAVLAFLLALFLRRFYDSIPLPKSIRERMEAAEGRSKDAVPPVNSTEKGQAAVGHKNQNDRAVQRP